jgi:DNA-binding CsgD family transcriptional regulator
MRGQMPSPGRPSTAHREHRVRFWEAIARGVTSDDAAVESGVASAVGTRWFRQGGGMPPISLAPHSGRYLSFREREEIAIMRAQQAGVREIARHLNRSPSTISRELRRNASTRSYAVPYRATTAQWHAERRASRPKVSTLAANDVLREYVQDRLAGTITRPDGELVPGPDVRWIGRRHGRRTGGGRSRGARSRSRTGSGPISPMMGPCASLMRPSTRRSTSKVEVPSSASSSHAFGPDGRCGFPGPGPRGGARGSSLPRS